LTIPHWLAAYRKDSNIVHTLKAYSHCMRLCSAVRTRTTHSVVWCIQFYAAVNYMLSIYSGKGHVIPL